MVVQNYFIHSILLLFCGLFSSVLNAACSSDVDMGTKKVVNLAEPTNASDAATKAYVDDISYYRGKGLILPTSPNTWKYTTVFPVVGAGMTCDTTTKEARCTMNSAGIMSVKIKVTSSNTGTACYSQIMLNTLAVPQVGAWSNNASGAHIGFATFQVAKDDVVSIRAFNLSNDDCSANPGNQSAFQMLKWR